MYYKKEVRYFQDYVVPFEELARILEELDFFQHLDTDTLNKVGILVSLKHE
jgi:hypothetical protein